MQKPDSVCFYSHFGNGDLFNSRMIIKEIVDSNPDINFYYAHAKNPNTFDDIPILKHTNILPFMNGMKPYVKGKEKDVYINTWIGRDSKYVLEGIGCTLEKYIEMFNDILPKVGLEILKGTASDYIPRIDYSYFPLSTLEFDINEHWGWTPILISNGDVQSNQAENFDFDPVIEVLLEQHPKILIYITAPSKIINSRIIDRSDYNLNKISHLSCYVKTIIGRSSGPYVFSQVLENLENPYKTFISFTYHENASKLSTTYQPKAKMVWSDATKTEKVSDVITRNL